jgi:hydrogenase maturation factor
MSKLKVRSNLDLGLESTETERLEAETREAGLLDASSLYTVLVMLDVIDTAEDLALLETLTPEQKRQIWDAIPDSTRARLKQLRTTLQLSPKLSPSLSHSHTTGLIDASELRAEDSLPDDPTGQAEETAAIDLEAQRQEVDLMLQEPLNLAIQPTVAIGDWVVLHAGAKLSKAEMQAIWEVIELQGNYVRIAAKNLGSRIYPTASMTLYPRPVELPSQSEPEEAEDLEPF